MGTDQGKLGNMHALGIISETASSKMGELGTTTFRHPTLLLLLVLSLEEMLVNILI